MNYKVLNGCNLQTFYFWFLSPFYKIKMNTLLSLQFFCESVLTSTKYFVEMLCLSKFNILKPFCCPKKKLFLSSVQKRHSLV